MTRHDPSHPRDGWKYPVIEKAEIMDCGLKLALAIRQSDGSVRVSALTLHELELEGLV